MKRFAFTLAELVIVIGIIGVIAEITIPELVQNFQEQATVTSLKKVYSTLSQAYTMAVQENGPPETWNASNPSDLMNNFFPFFRISKNCGTTFVNSCFALSDEYKRLNNLTWSNGTETVPKISLLDGSSVLFAYPQANCGLSRGTSLAVSNICSEIYVDINGLKKPNKVGVDFFFFYFTKYGIIPAGTSAETSYTFSTHCLNASALGSGFGCTAWVIYNENMDYLHCDDLSWTGKHKCD